MSNLEAQQEHSLCSLRSCFSQVRSFGPDLECGFMTPLLGFLQDIVFSLILMLKEAPATRHLANKHERERKRKNIETSVQEPVLEEPVLVFLC